MKLSPNSKLAILQRQVNSVVRCYSIFVVTPPDIEGGGVQKFNGELNSSSLDKVS